MSEKKKLNLFQKKINYQFKEISNLKESLTHPSHYKEIKSKKSEVNNFERLEFLGDRVLGLAISSLLFNKYKNINEGDLSKKYSYLVQKNFLFKISQDLLIKDVLLYSYNQNNKKMLTSIFSDAVESIIGAIYIDGGFKNSYNFVKKFWSPYLYIQISKTQDPKTALQEISQQISKKLPEYKLISKRGPSHIPVFTISLKVLNLKIIKAFGSSIREAESKAANEALKLLNEKEIN